MVRRVTLCFPRIGREAKSTRPQVKRRNNFGWRISRSKQTKNIKVAFVWFAETGLFACKAGAKHAKAIRRTVATRTISIISTQLNRLRKQNDFTSLYNDT